METLAQYSYFGQASSQACYLYGLVLLIASAWLALNMEKPGK